jgi:hypothetical protein
MPLVGMSGLVPLAVEVVPSFVSNTSAFLGFGILLGPAGFGSLLAVRRRWCPYGRGGASCWAVCLVEHDGASGAGLRGSGEISVGLADTDAVTPLGAIFPSRRALGETFLPCPCAYRGKPQD